MRNTGKEKREGIEGFSEASGEAGCPRSFVKLLVLIASQAAILATFPAATTVSY